MKRNIDFAPTAPQERILSASPYRIAEGLNVENLLWMKINKSFRQNRRRQVPKIQELAVLTKGHQRFGYEIPELLLVDFPERKLPQKEETDVKRKSQSTSLLTDLIKKENIELLVISAEGDCTLPCVPGNEIFEVLKEAKCPVLILPGNREIKEIKNIAYITDLRYCDMTVINPIVKIARPYNAKLDLVHLTADGLPDMAESYMDDYFHHELTKLIRYPVLAYTHLKQKNKGRELDLVAKEFSYDLLVLHWKRYGVFDKIFTENSKSYSFSKVPVIIFPS